MIRAVLVDRGGVLLQRPLHQELSRWDGALGLEPGRSSTALYRGTDATVLVGTVAADEHWRAVAHGLGLTAAEGQVVRDELVASEHLDTRLAAFVAGLRPRCRTALVTNLWSDGREECGRHGAEALVDELVISAEVGVAKPDAEIYRIALARLGAEPREAVLVDDLDENVASARGIGLHTVRYEGRPQAIAALEALLVAGAPEPEVDRRPGP